MTTNGLGVIFDMDGVLVDSYAAHFQSWKSAAQRYGLDMREEDFKATFGRTSRDIIRNLWGDKFNESKIAEFDEVKEADYRGILKVKLPVMAGAEELIAGLHEAGFKLAIGSSGPRENIAVVAAGLKHGKFFEAMTNGGEVKHGKPDPEVFLLCAKKLAIEPMRCAVIEDAPAGVEAARRAGMFSIGLLGTAPREVLAKHAHIVVAHLQELTPAMIAGWINGKK
jgi:beta-phosphoglucomutase